MNEIYEICTYETWDSSRCMENEDAITLDMGKEFYCSLGVFNLWLSSLHKKKKKKKKYIFL
jgi:hypothetical protein